MVYWDYCNDLALNELETGSSMEYAQRLVKDPPPYAYLADSTTSNKTADSRLPSKLEASQTRMCSLHPEDRHLKCKHQLGRFAEFTVYFNSEWKPQRRELSWDVEPHETTDAQVPILNYVLFFTVERRELRGNVVGTQDQRIQSCCKCWPCSMCLPSMRACSRIPIN